jgi:hypothetical protein
MSSRLRNCSSSSNSLSAPPAAPSSSPPAFCACVFPFLQHPGRSSWAQRTVGSPPPVWLGQLRRITGVATFPAGPACAAPHSLPGPVNKHGLLVHLPPLCYELERLVYQCVQVLHLLAVDAGRALDQQGRCKGKTKTTCVGLFAGYPLGLLNAQQAGSAGRQPTFCKVERGAALCKRKLHPLQHLLQQSGRHGSGLGVARQTSLAYRSERSPHQIVLQLIGDVHVPVGGQIPDWLQQVRVALFALRHGFGDA